jgi:hypothetical protein
LGTEILEALLPQADYERPQGSPNPGASARRHAEKRRLFIRPVLVGANIDPAPAWRSRVVDFRRFRRIAGPDREGLGSEPEVVDELGRIKTSKHGARARQ